MKFKRLLLSLSLGLMPVSISSAIDMKELFDSYSHGSAGTYQTSDGTSFYGGNFTTRAKIVNRDLFNINPPSIKAGCNGIDFFAGSFSVISGDEIVQMARGIAQGAAGYFFNMAVGSICASCLDNMREMAARLEELNKFSQNSCQNFWDNMTNAKTTAEKKENGEKGKEPLLDAASGWALGWADRIVGKGEQSLGTDKGQPGGGSIEAANQVYAGNLLFQKMDTSFTGLNLIFPGFNTEMEMKELFISLFGTVIVPLNDKPKPVHPINNLLVDLFNGTEEVKITRCMDVDCLSVEERSVSGFTSLYDYHLSMIGGPNGVIRTIKRKGNISSELQAYMLANDFNYSKAAQAFTTPQIDTLSRVIAAQIASQQLMDVHEQFVTLLYEMRNTPANADRMEVTEEVDAAILRSKVEMEKLRRVSEEKIQEAAVALNVIESLTRLMREKY